jgi:hypothetical protein
VEVVEGVCWPRGMRGGLAGYLLKVGRRGAAYDVWEKRHVRLLLDCWKGWVHMLQREAQMPRGLWCVRASCSVGWRKQGLYGVGVWGVYVSVASILNICILE